MVESGSDWGKWWNQARFAAAGRDDGVEALPLWVLRADVRSPNWNVLGDYLLSMWTGKHPERREWMGEGWALQAQAERRLRGWPSMEKVWGVRMWEEGVGRLRLELWRDSAKRIAFYQTHEAGGRALYWGSGDGIAELRRYFAQLTHNFNIDGVYCTRCVKYHDVFADEEAAHALGAWLFDADFRELEALKWASRRALGDV